MSSRTKVSKQVRIKQGGQIITFELTRRWLVVEQSEDDRTFTREFRLGKAAIDALRELLGMQQPSIVEAIRSRKEAKEKLTLPPEDFDERFRQEGQVTSPRESEGTPTPEGLTRKADGVEEGMGD